MFRKLMRSFWPDYSDRVVDGFVVAVLNPFFSVLGGVFNIVGTVIFIVFGWPFALLSWLRE